VPNGSFAPSPERCVFTTADRVTEITGDENEIVRDCLAWLAVCRGPAAADFTGAVAPATWTISNTGTLTGGSLTPGVATFSTSQLMLMGGNASSPGLDAPSCIGGVFFTLGPCQLQVTNTLAGSYSFTWNYLTSDPAGPAGDLFGVIVDSNRVQLSDPFGFGTQSGTRTFAATSSFGWFMNCTDCIGGSATTTISQFTFTPAIAEPESYVLIVAGVVGLAVRLRGQQRKSTRRVRRDDADEKWTERKGLR